MNLYTPHKYDMWLNTLLVDPNNRDVNRTLLISLLKTCRVFTYIHMTIIEKPAWFQYDGFMQKGCGGQNWQKSKIWYEKQYVLAQILIYIACL